jgi:hypothetical protein
MARTIKADGDVWRGQLSERPVRPGYQTIVFFCVSNGQRPYRVVEVPRERVGSQDDLDHLSDTELRALFEESSSMSLPLE